MVEKVEVGKSITPLLQHSTTPGDREARLKSRGKDSLKHVTTKKDLNNVTPKVCGINLHDHWRSLPRKAAKPLWLKAENRLGLKTAVPSRVEDRDAVLG